MADRMAASMTWLAEKMASNLSREVVYEDERGRTVSVNAMIGRTEYELVDADGGVRQAWTDRDFIIRPEELIINDVQIDPKRGHRIRETVDDTVMIYEVMPIPGQQEVKEMAHREQWRIHTKFVGQK